MTERRGIERAGSESEVVIETTVDQEELDQEEKEKGKNGGSRGALKRIPNTGIGLTAFRFQLDARIE